MIIEIQTPSEVKAYDLDALAVTYAGIISVGRKCKEVWNAIALEAESLDPFQCHLIGSAGGTWRLNHGQRRTECPKGLVSDRLIPCNGCTGRCVNIHPGRPKYLLRTPATPTLVNGQPVGEYGIVINAGDIITLGDVVVRVK